MFFYYNPHPGWRGPQPCVHFARTELGLCTYSARTLHMFRHVLLNFYICFGTYSSCFGKSTRYAVQRCVRTSLALVHRHWRSFIVIGIYFRAIFCRRSPFENKVNISWWAIPFPLHTFCLSHRIVLPLISASNEKFPWERIESLQKSVNLMISLVANVFCQPERFSCQGSNFSNLRLLA